MVLMLLVGRKLLVAHIMMTAAILMTAPQTVIVNPPHIDVSQLRPGRLITVRSPFDFAAAPGHIKIAPRPNPISD